MNAFATALRRGAAPTSLLPRRGIDELWKGGYLDPAIGAKQKEANAVSGDAWPACLLRLKSFEDLHKLWYICLKEKNLLMGERWAARQHKQDMKEPERLQKVRRTMRRILIVLTKREIQQQCLRARDILAKQQKREALETRRFQLEEKMLQLEHRIRRMEPAQSLMKEAWQATLDRYRADHEDILIQLHPLRKETTQLLAPDWRYERKYSDLPGPIRWKKQYIPALEDQYRKPIRFH
ncbi:putative 39S ribosomal protein L47 [Besnoitia besnoiti]|uniref:Large ribosomal subunit protein uL29m n=1 Tax=Besnoitia besnoiti TaxID=94643 RepID=A0A2A9MIA3_BESBE|nr:putative 39S ribosomal protein L47 [Besnoitia besnoiti]PFH37715.1 putative 39S ribosomal protein L47 [Besnoitia besnoiti]